MVLAAGAAASGAAAGAAGALVLAVGGVPSCGLLPLSQPVSNDPATMPNKTNRVYVLFIVVVTLTKPASRTRKIFYRENRVH